MEQTITMKIPQVADVRVCKECGEEKPISNFRMAKGGVRLNTCNACCNAKAQETKRLRKMGGGGTAERCQPFYDADFEGKQPVEVIQLMSRAKKWLESRGYEITLKGKYTITKDVKF